MNEGAEVTLVARMRIVHVLYIVWTQPQLGLPQHWTWTWVEGVGISAKMMGKFTTPLNRPILLIGTLQPIATHPPINPNLHQMWQQLSQLV